MIRKSVILPLTLFFAVSAVHAGGKGTTSAAFMKVPVNPRAVGMAGSFTAVSGDVTGIEYNPAGLAGLRRTDIALTYIDYIEDTSFQSVAIGIPFNIPGIKPAAAPEGLFDRTKMIAALRYNQFQASDQ